MRRWMIALLTVAAFLLLVVLIGVGYAFPWTGFGNSGNQSPKTLWDWLQLLIIPAVLTLGGLWFNAQQSRTQQRLSDQQHLADEKRAEERRKADEELAKDQQREDSLQSYLDRMSELLLEKSLRTSDQQSEIRQVARARTLTVLRKLNGDRKAALLRFLYEADLLNHQSPIIDLGMADLSAINLWGANLPCAALTKTDLSRADLREADLNGASLEEATICEANLSLADLHEADLSRANLRGADLFRASLRGAHLFRANLRGANLRGANLRQVDLREADLREADLSGANLSGANLMNGMITDEQLATALELKETILPLTSMLVPSNSQKSEDSTELMYEPLSSAGKVGGTLILPSGRRIALSGKQAVVGRDELAEVNLSSEEGSHTVSRKVAHIMRIDNHFELEALSSANGIRLNDQLLEPGQNYRLSNGDVIHFAAVRCVFSI